MQQLWKKKKRWEESGSRQARERQLELRRQLEVRLIQSGWPQPHLAKSQWKVSVVQLH